jgi:hypothetical protein
MRRAARGRCTNVLEKAGDQRAGLDQAERCRRTNRMAPAASDQSVSSSPAALPPAVGGCCSSLIAASTSVRSSATIRRVAVPALGDSMAGCCSWLYVQLLLFPAFQARDRQHPVPIDPTGGAALGVLARLPVRTFALATKLGVGALGSVVATDAA